MAKEEFQVGDIIILISKELHGVVGIVSKPITKESTGHVLIHKGGHIIGVETSIEEVISADEGSQGFAQLAYNLIKLGSHVIEERLLSII